MKGGRPGRASPLWFVIRYFLLMSIFLLAIGFEPLREVLDINGLYTAGVVWLTGWLLSICGFRVYTHGSIISLSGKALNVLFGCNGLEAIFIFAAAVLAYPAPWRQRLLGLGFATAVIFFLNVVRIAALGLIAARWPGAFHLFHIYIAQGMMIAVSLVLFLVWLGWVREA